MKKTISLIAVTLFFAGSVSAQGLGSLLKNASTSDVLGSLSKVVYSFTGNLTAVDLPGTWTYTGSAVSLGGDNALTNVAGTAVSSGVESKVDEYLKKVGVTSGALVFTFNEDLTFTCTAKGIPVNGTWKTLNEGEKVQLQFGKNLKFLSMTGTLKQTGANSCQVLFEGSKFLSFVKTILSYAAKQSSAASAVSSLAGNYSNMQIGMTLKKQ